jgi:hypothetical protein
MYQRILTPRSGPIVTITQLCNFARVDVPEAGSDDEDTIITFIAAATDTVEIAAATACFNEQMLETYDYFPGQQDPRNYLYSELNYAFTATPYWWYGFPTNDSIELVRRPVLVPTLSPVANTLTIQYNDPNGVQQTLDPASYTVFANKITLNIGFQWPVTDRRQDCIQITYWAGYSENDPMQVPAQLRMAIMFLGSHFLDNRAIIAVEPTSEIAVTLSKMLQSFKSCRIAR